MRKRILLPLLLCMAFVANGQGMVQIKGVVYDADSNEILDSVTVIVKNTSRIIQNKADGSFSVFVKPTDTIIFGLYGYKVKYMCFKDSVGNRDYYNIRVNMFHLTESINEITITEIRTQREVRRDLNNLVVEHAFSLERANGFESPVSYIYQKNSRRAQTKQLLVEYEFQLAKNQLIRQLLDIYNKQGIIDIPTDQYKAFVEDLNLEWDYLYGASDYDLAAYIKQKALEWKQ